MLEKLDTIDWANLPQPEWNKPGAVPHAIRSLANCTGGSDAYNQLLYAIGNNSAGTYFPVVLQVVPFLGEILAGPSVPARASTLDILIDLLASFTPDFQFEKFDTPAGPQELADALHAEVRKLTPIVEELHSSRGVPAREMELAGWLLDLINEP